MAYEIIVLDLDGTLTNSKKELTEPTRKALIDIQKRGKKVVLASGRPTEGVLPFAQKLELEKYGGYILSYNGGHIRNCSTNDIIYNESFPQDIIPAFYNVVKNYDVDLTAHHNNLIISGICPNQYVELEALACSMQILRVNNFPEYINFPINKLLVNGEPDLLKELKTILTDMFSERVDIYLSDPYYLDIMPPGINKANSLKALLEHLKLSSECLICCGDGYNDISMLKFAGLGVAMGNAQAELKDVADFITKTNNEDGIAHVIETFMK